MKSKLLLLSFLMLFTFTTTYAQTSAGQAGIAVQGIARDINNTALASQDVSFVFEIYYIEGGSEKLIKSVSTELRTDAFGVFSYVIDANSEGDKKSPKFANHRARLRITAETEEISDEFLRHVPYAIAANNGVPTGSIMPFIGTTVPEGWALCDGTDLPAEATKLIGMIGTATPNLKGMFLRGAGGSGDHRGPDLKVVQQDAFKKHLHTNGTLDVPAGGEHEHFYTSGYKNTYGISNGDYDDGELGRRPATNLTIGGGSHDHDITGAMDYAGTVDETRPINYGVNYIIKL